MEKIEKIKPFKRFCMTIGELPSSYVETMSYYEMILWFTNFLQNTVIPTINNNATAVEELQSLFIELKNYVDNYFENLDVQEEINNKLDEMAEDGTLAEIIAEYLQLQSILCYENVSSLRQATNITNGSLVETFGFYSVGDGGSAKYYVRPVTNEDVIDNIKIIALTDNTLVAQLLYSDVKVKQFGCYGDGIHDDTANLQKCFNENKNIIFDSCTYLTSDIITLENSNIIIEGNNATIVPDNDNKNCFNINGDYNKIKNLNINGTSIYGFNVNGDYNTIENSKIENIDNSAIMMTGSYNLVNNVIAIEVGWDCVSNYGSATHNTITNSKAIRTKRHGFSTDPTTSYIIFENCYAEDIGNPSLDEGHTCFHIEYCDNASIMNCSYLYTGNHINNIDTSTNSQYIGVRVDNSNNCLIDNLRGEYESSYQPLNSNFALHVSGSSTNTKIINSNLLNNSNSTYITGIYLQALLSINNCNLLDIDISTQDGYSGRVKEIINSKITLVNKLHFAYFQYLLENANITDTEFKGTSNVDYFIKGRFVNCTFRNCTFDTAKESIYLDKDVANANSKSEYNVIESCLFKDVNKMFSFIQVTNNNVNFMNNCSFTGTCDYVYEGNYNSMIITNSRRLNLTVNQAIQLNTYLIVYDDLKTNWDYTLLTYQESTNYVYRVGVNTNGTVFATRYN